MDSTGSDEAKCVDAQEINCVQRKYCYFGQIKLGWALADLKGEGVIMGLLSLLNYFFSRKCYDTKQLKMHRNSYIGII